MRQTSKAVLLLLASASAAETDPGWVTATQTATTQGGAATLATQGTAQLLKNPIYQSAFKVASVLPVVAASATAPAGITEGTLSCMDCIRGVNHASNAVPVTVWCSAGWNYEYTTLAIANGYPLSKVATPITWVVTGAGDGAAIRAGDQGTCCYTLAEQAAMVIKPTSTVGGSDQNSEAMNKFSCPSKYTNAYAAKSAMSTTFLAFQTTNWWCSDGTFNLTDSVAYATEGAAATGNIMSKTAFATTAGAKLVTAATDRRNELFYAACRQKKSICGAGHIAETGDDASKTRAILKAATGGFSTGEKCTYVVRSKTMAPTFKISNVTTAKQLPVNYDVVYQEWVEGWQLAAGTDYLSGHAAAGTAYNQGGIPLPSMVAANYGKAAKWNYSVGAVNGSEKNNMQIPGQAYVFTQAQTGCALTDGNFGTMTPTNCWDESNAAGVKRRWFNLDTSGVVAQNAQATAYDTAKASFNTKAATYNTFLADLKKANETDAFAAFFSPPKKPAMVVRPAAPTMPAAYTGLQHWSGAKQQLYWNKKPAGVPTFDTDYIMGNQAQNGGWGAWTISRIAGGYDDAKTQFISHSFGMLGTKQGTVVANTMSYVKNWEKDAVTTTAETLRAAEAGSIMCQSVTGTAPTCLNNNGPPGTASVINTKYVYLNLSVWGSGGAAQTSTQFNTAAIDFTVTFYASAWADGKSFYAPADSVAGTTLTTPAAAQALAASAAAVVAVAAALY